MWNWIGKAEELKNEGRPFVMLTVTQVTGSTPRETGAKMICLADGTFFGTIGGGNLENKVLDDAQMNFIRTGVRRNQARVIRYPLGAKTGQCCGGIMEILFEPIHCGPQLYLFGAGHVGQAVCKVLQGTPFQVQLIDERPEWIESPELPTGVIRHALEWSEFVAQADWSEQNTYVVIMTHRHDQDQEILHSILSRSRRYLGLIGSQSKWLRFQQRLRLRGVPNEELNRVTCPIGLPIGGKAPQEVAISLSAELLKIYYKNLNN